MKRRPFNPALLPDIDAGPPALRDMETRGSFDTANPMSVTQVSELIKSVLADRTPAPLHVVGEVSNFSDRQHWYLSLKDEASVISCVMWASAAKKCGFTPQRGQQVVAKGRLDYYGPQGRLQFYIESLEPVGQGVLELRFRQLCEELKKLGYFDDERKKPMPRFPLHIAVVTSANGAALQDVIRTARQRWAGIRLSLFDVRVQGEGAAEEIAEAVTLLSKQRESLGVDALILTRGGGSLEDLWAFNERVVADAVFRSKVPIAAAIGHETDTTVAELVADLRCSTPTQAAARLVPDARAELQRLEQVTTRLAHALRRTGQHARARLDGVASHPIFRRPLDRFVQHRTRLDVAARSLTSAMSRFRADRSAKLDALQRQLNAVGPTSVLGRGYTYTTGADGTLIRSARRLHAGELIRTHFADGQVESQVTGEKQARETNKDVSLPPGKRTRKSPDTSPRLFEL